MTTITNAVTGRSYGAANAKALAKAASERAYTSSEWATYRQWLEIGRQVRKGERGTTIGYMHDGRRKLAFLFNREQTEATEGASDAQPAAPAIVAPIAAPPAREGFAARLRRGIAALAFWRSRTQPEQQPDQTPPAAPAAPVAPPQPEQQPAEQPKPDQAPPAAPPPAAPPVDTKPAGEVIDIRSRLPQREQSAPAPQPKPAPRQIKPRVAGDAKPHHAGETAAARVKAWASVPRVNMAALPTAHAVSESHRSPRKSRRDHGNKWQCTVTTRTAGEYRYSVRTFGLDGEEAARKAAISLAMISLAHDRKLRTCWQRKSNGKLLRGFDPGALENLIASEQPKASAVHVAGDVSQQPKAAPQPKRAAKSAKAPAKAAQPAKAARRNGARIPGAPGVDLGAALAARFARGHNPRQVRAQA